MKQDKTHSLRLLIIAALCLALALVLPFLTGQIREIGNMLCPMHIPILLCGYLAGGVYGAAVGFLAPIVRFLLFGMPPLMPTGLAMAFELATYGFVAGALYRKFPKKTLSAIYVSLLAAMVAGRLVWGIVQFLLAGLQGTSFPFSAFLAGALLNAIPGILLQLVLIPVLVRALKKAGF